MRVILWVRLVVAGALFSTSLWGYAEKGNHCLGKLSGLNPYLIKLKESYTVRVDSQELTRVEKKLMEHLEDVADKGGELPLIGTAEEVTSRIHHQIAMNEARLFLLSVPGNIFEKQRIDQPEREGLQRLILEFAVDFDSANFEPDVARSKDLLLKHPDEVIALAEASFSVIGKPIETDDPEKLLVQKIFLKLGHLGTGPEITRSLEHYDAFQKRHEHFADLLEGYLLQADVSWPVADDETLRSFLQAIP